MTSFTPRPKVQMTLASLLKSESKVVVLHITKVGKTGMVLGGSS